MPLSADAFPFMLAAFFSEMPDSFNRRLRALLASHDLQDGELVTEDVGSALRVKLLALAAAGHIPQPDLACEALDFPVATSVCPLCGLGLAPLPPLLGLMLRLAGPCSPARCGRAECTHCRVTCVACFWTKQGSGACAFHCHPRDAAVFPLVLEHSQPASPHFVRFVEPSLLHFLTFAVLHWRASFDGMARIWTRMWGHSVSCRVAMKVFHLWLYWRAQCLLADDLLCADARGIACSLGAASDNAAALSRLTVLVQETFLQRYCREHVCATCSQIRSVGVDNKVNLSVRLCADVAGCPRDYARVGLSVDFGCTEMPCPRSSFCRSHAPPAPLIASAAPSACPLEHPLATQTVLADGFAYTCDLCSAALPVGVTFHTCPAGCSYDVCRTCFVQCRPSFASASSGRTPAAHPAWMLAERDFDTCGLAKPLPTLGARRTGGVLTFVLACGTVCHVSACAGGESCTQICGLLGDIRSRRDVQFVVYDNACMLARFVRNRAARRRGRGSSTLQQLASECNYVLDRFHARNHRACLNPQHALYLPEVDIARHPTLAALNTSQNEQWNNWLGHFSHTLRHMHFRTMELYLLLVADLWNTFVVPCRSTGDATQQPSACEERPTSSSLLKRRREQPARRLE